MDNEPQRVFEAAFVFDDPVDVVQALGAAIYERAQRLKLHLHDLSPIERLILYLLWFDQDVSHGGFHSFFANPSGDYARDVLEMLREIGAEETVSRFEQALAVFPDGQPARDHETRLRQMERFDAESLERLQWLSDVYYEQNEDIYDLALAFLQEHRAELVQR